MIGSIRQVRLVIIPALYTNITIGHLNISYAAK